MILIDGKKIRENILAEIKKEVAKLSFQPVFCDVLVGEDPASAQYVRMKARTAESVGIHFHSASFPLTITTEELVKEIEILNKMENMCGIIVQLPLPQELDKKIILDAIDPRLDVDCLGEVASLEFYQGNKERIEKGFPTALACMSILDSLGLDLKDKSRWNIEDARSKGPAKIIVLGQGMLVGKPVSALLNFRNISFAPIDARTPNKEQLIKEADVIISGIGKGKHITGDMIKKGVVLIDAGTSESGGGIVGDVDLESVKGIASVVSPVPGGVGPVTVAMLLKNVLTVAKNK